jgi:hypothetical protein
VEKERTRLRRRGVAIAAVLSAAALALIPSAAQGAATTIPFTLYAPDVNAAPGTANAITVDYACAQPHTEEDGTPTGLYNCAETISDLAGIFVVPAELKLCFQQGANTAVCSDPSGQGVAAGSTGPGLDTTVSLGDQRDSLFADTVGSFGVDGGPGDDRLLSLNRPIVVGGGFSDEPESADFGGHGLNGGPGNDQISGLDGPQGINGGPGKDRMSGGTDNDFIDAKDGRSDGKVKCGPGKDMAVIDKADSVSGCEKIKGV